MSSRTTLLAVAAILLATARFAIAWPDEQGPRGPHRGRHPSDRFATALENNADRLGLSDETLAKIRAIVAERKAIGEKLHSEVFEARRDMHELLSGDRPDEEAAMKQADRIGKLETKALKHRLRTLLRIRPLLTDAQVDELRKIREERFAPVREACREEIEAWCSKAAQGPEAWRCLHAHERELSEACLDKLKTRRRGRASRR